MVSWADEERRRIAEEVRAGDRSWYTVLLEGYTDWEDHFPLRGIYVHAASTEEAREMAERNASDKEGIRAIFAIRLVDELGRFGFKEVRNGAE